jgi:hypothetical protein
VQLMKAFESTVALAQILATQLVRTPGSQNAEKSISAAPCVLIDSMAVCVSCAMLCSAAKRQIVAFLHEVR